MKKGYIQSIGSVLELQQIVKAMNDVGVSSDNIFIEPSFSTFVRSVASGESVVVYNLDFFSSLSDLMNFTIELAQRGVYIESLSEPWYSVSPEMVSLLRGVNSFGQRIRASRTRAGLSKAKAEGKILGRPVGSTKLSGKILAITKLREESHLSVAKACEVVKCNPRSYYRHVSKE